MLGEINNILTTNISSFTTKTTTTITTVPYQTPQCIFSYPDVTPTTRYIAGIGFATCGVLAALGNTISLLIIATHHKMRRSKSNRIIASLTMSDVLVGYIFCPLIASQLLSER